jgi:hypothetical protein
MIDSIVNSSIEDRIAAAKAQLDSMSLTAFDRPAAEKAFANLLAEKATQKAKLSFWFHPVTKALLTVATTFLSAWLLWIFNFKK